ncbi:MAG: 50S ribosomal protein L25/general stress protein Ctc [Austwickia sp.]|jgi:large subunit ribosomal protein L25|nr:MAG: 50S ribosomal protein L25/general stress protein Ctc [Austwickia sp.]
MADTVKITAEKRTEFGKGAARRIRRESKIPAVLYGHGADPIHLTLPGHDTMLAVKTANAVLNLVIDGKDQLALVKDVQRDILKPVIEHIDLVIVRRGEKVVVDVAVTTVGEAAIETLVNVESQTLQVQAEATRIPTGFEVSVEGLAAGTQILASQIELPSGVELVTDPETLVVNVTQAISAEALEAELAEAEAEAGIEKEESGDEAPVAEAGEEKPADAKADDEA